MLEQGHGDTWLGKHDLQLGLCSGHPWQVGTQIHQLARHTCSKPRSCRRFECLRLNQVPVPLAPSSRIQCLNHDPQFCGTTVGLPSQSATSTEVCRKPEQDFSTNNPIPMVTRPISRHFPFLIFQLKSPLALFGGGRSLGSDPWHLDCESRPCRFGE